MTFTALLCKMICMGFNDFQINPQLAADSHELFDWQHCHLRLHNNASLPWLIIIPYTHVVEFHDLPAELQLEISHISQIVSNYFKAEFGAKKINFAAIGNVVQQLHIHVVGRNPQDPLWPAVVWGNPLPDKSYETHQLKAISKNLIQQLRKRP